jgi:tetratricopeptide (TPR) repeat protein
MKFSYSRNLCSLILVLCGGLSFCSECGAATKVDFLSRIEQASRPANPESFEKVADDAQAAMAANRIPEAIRLYGRATELKPAWSQGWWHLGTLLFDSGRYREARDAFAHFVSVERREPGPGLAMLGLSDFQLKRYSEALSAMERGIKLGLGDNPEFSETVLYRDGILQTKMGQPEIALQRLTLDANRLAAAHPDSSSQAVLGNDELVNAFGLAALRIPKLPSEIQDSEKLVVRLAGRAQTLVALSDRTAAEAQLKELLALYPSHAGVHSLYGVFLTKEHPPLALDEFRREIEVNPLDAVARIQLAFGLLNVGDYEQGLRFARQAVALAPDNFIAHVVCGRLWLELGKTEEAVQQLRTAGKQAPNSPDAHFALSRALSQAGRKSEAAHERQEFEHMKALAEAHNP